MKIVIDSVEKLKQTVEYCRNQSFDADRIIFEKTSNIFMLEFVRAIREEAVLKMNLLLFKIFAASKTRSILRFNRVLEMELFCHEPSDELETIIYEPEKNTIVFNSRKGTKIKLKVENLDGELLDIGERVVNRHRHLSLYYWIEF